MVERDPLVLATQQLSRRSGLEGPDRWQLTCFCPPPSLEICCRACMGFYRWVMVAATGGVGVAATLCLCSLLIWPVRLRSCES